VVFSTAWQVVCMEEPHQTFCFLSSLVACRSRDLTDATNVVVSTASSLAQAPE